MPLEILAILVSVFGHRDRQQHLNLKSHVLRIQQSDLGGNKPAFLKIADTAPDRTARHAGYLGKLTLTARRVILQGVEQPIIRS